MLLVDTSVWVDHLREPDRDLVEALGDARVLGHPAVVGEVALRSLPRRQEVLSALDGLPSAVPASDDEARLLLERHRLWGRGVGWVDLHLLASVRLTAGASLWTRDRRLRRAAEALGVAADLP